MSFFIKTKDVVSSNTFRKSESNRRMGGGDYSKKPSFENKSNNKTGGEKYNNKRRDEGLEEERPNKNKFKEGRKFNSPQNKNENPKRKREESDGEAFEERKNNKGDIIFIKRFSI